MSNSGLNSIMLVCVTLWYVVLHGVHCIVAAHFNLWLVPHYSGTSACGKNVTRLF